MQMLIIGKGLFYGPPLHFAKMRCALAAAAGIPLTKLHVISDEGDDVAIQVPDLDGFGLTEKNIYGEWDEVPDDPILILLAHSDETGVIKDEHILPLVSRISELIGAACDWTEETYGIEEGQAVYNDLHFFADALSAAYSEGSLVEFIMEDVPE